MFIPKFILSLVSGLFLGLFVDSKNMRNPRLELLSSAGGRNRVGSLVDVVAW